LHLVPIQHLVFVCSKQVSLIAESVPDFLGTRVTSMLSAAVADSPLTHTEVLCSWPCHHIGHKPSAACQCRPLQQ